MAIVNQLDKSRAICRFGRDPRGSEKMANGNEEDGKTKGKYFDKKTRSENADFTRFFISERTYLRTDFLTYFISAREITMEM